MQPTRRASRRGAYGHGRPHLTLKPAKTVLTLGVRAAYGQPLPTARGQFVPAALTLYGTGGAGDTTTTKTARDGGGHARPAARRVRHHPHRHLPDTTTLALLAVPVLLHLIRGARR